MMRKCARARVRVRTWPRTDVAVRIDAATPHRQELQAHRLRSWAGAEAPLQRHTRNHGTAFGFHFSLGFRKMRFGVQICVKPHM